MKTNHRHLFILLAILLAAPAFLAAAEPTAQEQMLLERINRARLHQAEESRRLNLDFQEGMTATIAADLEPLIWNPNLQTAAAEQNQDMFERNYFAHIAPDGTRPLDRVQRHVDTFIGVGQNLGAGRMYASADALYVGWMIDAGVTGRGHRAVILSRWIDSFGAARADHTLSYFGTYWTANVGISKTKVAHVTGVVYRDLNCNGQYDDGEGLTGWKLRVTAQSPATDSTPGSDVAYATAADADLTATDEPAWTPAYATGGYALPVDGEGDYTVEALAPNGDLYLQTVGVENRNVKIDFEVLNTTAPIFTAAPTAGVTASSGNGGKKSGCSLGATPSTGWSLLLGMGLLCGLMLALRSDR